MKKLTLCAVVLAILTNACIPTETNPLDTAARSMTAAMFGEPRPMPARTLVDQNGDPFDLRIDTQDQLTLLFFGYTSCPDICPITMATVARAMGMLEPSLRERVEVLFVTLDANRDGVDEVKAWLGGIDSTFIGVTGSQEELEGVLADFGYVMPPFEIPTEGFYEVPHPAEVFLFTPERLARFGYMPNTPPEAIAADLAILAEVWWPTEGGE